jgi:hypothetical protein
MDPIPHECGVGPNRQLATGRPKAPVLKASRMSAIRPPVTMG